MVLRMSTLFLRTLREDPVDAEVPSHRLLVRAGYVRRAAPGIYSWLPLGYRVLRNVERIVREEMDAIGAQEVHFPALLPREPYEATGRWTEYGDSIFRLKDRKGNDYLLGPDARGDVHPARQGPVLVVQGSAAVALPDPDEVPRRAASPRRDPARPRVRHEGLLLVRRRRRGVPPLVPARIATPTCGSSTGSGFDYVIVAAMSGAMGGSASEEFLATSATGEDTYVRCTNCDYAANVEAVRVPVPDADRPYDDLPPAHVEDTPDTPTIETLVDHLNDEVPAATTGPGRPPTPSRTCSCTVDPPRRRVASRWPSACPATGRSTSSGSAPRSNRPSSRRSTRRTSRRTPAWPRDTSGPARSGKNGTSGIRYLLDPRVVDGHRVGDRRRRSRAATCSGWSPAATSPRDGTIEAADVRDGDPCPRCGDARSRPRAASRWATSSSSARSTPRRWTCRCSTRTASS